jgi:hypothetical protein
MWMERAQRRAVLPANGGYHILRHYADSRIMPRGLADAVVPQYFGASSVLLDAA